jgi:hypothetical protein
MPCYLRALGASFWGAFGYLPRCWGWGLLDWSFERPCLCVYKYPFGERRCMGERVFGGRLPASRLLFFVEWFGFIEPWVTGFPTGSALMVSGASKTLVSQQLQWLSFCLCVYYYYYCCCCCDCCCCRLYIRKETPRVGRLVLHLWFWPLSVFVGIL